MDWSSWEPFYKKLAIELNLNIEQDYKAADEFKNIVMKINQNGYRKNLEKLKKKKSDYVWIFGAGPSLDHDFSIFVAYSTPKDLIVGVDGACLFLLQHKIYPDIIFSDLDGSLEAIETCLQHGSILILHAHGDNSKIVQQFSPKLLPNNFIPTIQTKPDEPFLYNFGGFTDGDRAISAILTWFLSVKVLLLGFTFGKIQGKYSKPTILKNHSEASEFKLKKLSFAKYFIKYLAKEYKNSIYNLSKPTENIEGVNENLDLFK